jgi:hypothetical protein
MNDVSAAKISYLNKNQVLEELCEENSDEAVSTNLPKSKIYTQNSKKDL